MKVVLDTNVLISALISPHNPPDLILQSWLAGDFELLTSEDQLEEIRRVSRYAHLQPFLQPHRVGVLVNRMRSLATIVRPESLISEEALDPDDNFLIAICEPENRGIYTQSDSSKKSSRNIWSLAVVSVDQRY